MEEPKAEERQRLELSPSANEWAAIQNTTSLAVLARFKERYPDPPWSEYADIRATELREADEHRRDAEAKRAEKTDDATLSKSSRRSKRPRSSPNVSAPFEEHPTVSAKDAEAAGELLKEGKKAQDFSEANRPVSLDTAREKPLPTNGGAAKLLDVSSAAEEPVAPVAPVRSRFGRLDQSYGPAAHWPLVISVAFAILVVPFQFLLVRLFQANEWDWLGVGPVEPAAIGVAAAATALLFGLGLTLGMVVVIALWRAGRLSRAEIFFYWFGCTLAAVINSVPFARAANNGITATGYSIAFALAPAIAVAALVKRNGRVSGIEIGVYWFGCILAASIALASVFAPTGWIWFGAAVLGPVSAGMLAYWRRDRISATEVAIYAFGIGLPFAISAAMLWSFANSKTEEPQAITGQPQPVYPSSGETHAAQSPASEQPSSLAPSPAELQEIKDYKARAATDKLRHDIVMSTAGNDDIRRAHPEFYVQELLTAWTTGDRTTALKLAEDDVIYKLFLTPSNINSAEVEPAEVTCNSLGTVLCRVPYMERVFVFQLAPTGHGWLVTDVKWTEPASNAAR
jgi:hypothetical protein